MIPAMNPYSESSWVIDNVGQGMTPLLTMSILAINKIMHVLQVLDGFGRLITRNFLTWILQIPSL